MSIRSDYNPEAEHIREVLASIDRKLGPVWWFFVKDEKSLELKLLVSGLTDEEKCYARDQYRQIKNREREQRERERVLEIRKRRHRGELIGLAILVLIGMLIAIVAGEAKERRLKNAETTVSEMKP